MIGGGKISELWCRVPGSPRGSVERPSSWRIVEGTNVCWGEQGVQGGENPLWRRTYSKARFNSAASHRQTMTLCKTQQRRDDHVENDCVSAAFGLCGRVCRRLEEFRSLGSLCFRVLFYFVSEGTDYPSQSITSSLPR